MAGMSTPRYPGYEQTSQAVSPFITLGILVAGVIGGLVIVIAFILFCKYCVRRKGTGLRRDQGTDCELSSERRFKPFQRYETINSDMFSEPSTGSMDGLPVSPRKLLESKTHDKLSTGIEEATETTRLNTDFEKAAFCETTLETETNDWEPVTTGASCDASSLGRVESRESCVSGNGGAVSDVSERSGRRVSFQLDNLPQSPSGYLRKGRRYTEGDFHYLKNSRITKQTVPRQYSLMIPSNSDHDASKSSNSHLPSTSKCTNYITSYINPGSNSSLPKYAHGYLLDSPTIGTIPERKPHIVNVEVHERFDLPTLESKSNRLQNSHSYSRTSPPKSQARLGRLQPTSYSMDTVSPTDTSAHKDQRRVKSYDDVVYYDYDVLKITEFSRGPFFNSEFDPIMEVEGLVSSKVRYNDMGSLEVLNEDKIDSYDEFEFENNIIPDESDADTETTINGAQQFREIWNLRATFEEEEECSDTIRMEDMASPDESSSERGCEPTPASYSPTFLKSGGGSCMFNPGNIGNGVAHAYDANGSESFKDNSRQYRRGSYVDPQHVDPEDANLLHPNYENRRDDFRKVVNRRYQKRGSTSAENSFDSVETGDTDGDVTESSRHEATTSFESTTDNTDSTNDSQTSRLRQMKADSGYKSMENQLPSSSGSIARKSPNNDDEITVLSNDVTTNRKPQSEVLEGVGTNEPVNRRGSLFEKRRGRTASKRRREYSRERQVIRLNENAYEPETDSTRSDQPSGDSLEEQTTPNTKLSLFSRFFKSHRSNRESKGLTRDFSIDEKTNSIFQEFVRYDPKFDSHRRDVAGFDARRHRLQRKYTDPGPTIGYEDRKWLSPEMRSTSLGSDSSASSARRPSPQDSIDEEGLQGEVEEEDIDAAVLDHKNRVLEKQEVTSGGAVAAEVTITPTVHEIPIIKLPEEESVNV